MNENTNQVITPAPTAVFAGLAACQTELSNPAKDSQGYGYKYSTLDQILTLVKPVLAKYKLGVYQTPVGEIENESLKIKTCLFHANGQFIETEFSLPIKFGSNPIQDFGAALTYGKRYALLGLLSIFPEDEDTDGVGSKEVKKKPSISKKKPSISKKKDPPKNPIRDPKLVDAVEKRLDELEILDWAEDTNFIPHKTSEPNLTRFLEFTDEDLLTKVKDWESKKEGAA